MKRKIFNFSVEHPKAVMTLVGIITVLFLIQFPKINIDTDPENMLSHEEHVRLVHDDLKETFELHDMLVVGIFKESGVFNKETIGRVIELTEEVKEIEGVIEDDIMSISEIDDIKNEGSTIRVSRLAEYEPDTDEEAAEIRERIELNPILKNKLASDDGQLIGIYIPIEEKKFSYRISQEIDAMAGEIFEDEQYYIAGLPMAEDTFGNEMFRQMGLVAPVTGLIIFLLMISLFKKVKINIAPMILAMVTVIWTMGLLIGLGFTVHIMSSMIPIFLFPIAVLNSVHIINDLLDKYGKHRDLKRSILLTMDELFSPMLFTSLTTFAGFISLTLTPIPPVQIFGVFVGFGIATAWLLSMTFVPAYASMLSDKSLAGMKAKEISKIDLLQRVLNFVEKHSISKSKAVLAITSVMLMVSVIGISRIVVNDNPVNWFKPDHPLRVADNVMNSHMGGTYMSNLIFEGDDEIFKDPEVVSYVEGIQNFIKEQNAVGATSSIADVLKKISYELKGVNSLPDNSDEIGQYYFIYEMAGGDPEDLFKFITPEYNKAHIWIQMTEGDNVLMKNFVDKVNTYMDENPLPVGLTKEWAGLNYINVVWQDKMVKGMLSSLLGGFGVVFVMMVFLFRSVILAVLSMIPLSATITFIYALVGFTGKSYDMPIAVLSSLTLGLSIDFAIHFIKRSQFIHSKIGNFGQTMKVTFSEPARAISINMMVIAIGFVPLFASNLVPYVTVGIFFFLIMLSSGIATLIIMPAISKVLQKRLYPETKNTIQGGKDKMKATIKPVMTALLAVVMSSMAVFNSNDSAAQTTEEIMKESHLRFYYAANDGLAEVEMKLINKKGKERTRKFMMLRKDFVDGGEQKYYTYFLEPNDVKRTTFTVWKDPQNDDSRWIYIPSIDLVKQIAAKDKDMSFVGSDFTYEDVSGRHWSEDVHTIEREENIDGQDAWVIKSVSKDKKAKITHKISWISRENYLPIKEEYYDKKDRLVRTFKAEDIIDVNGVKIPTKRTMEDLKKKHKTVVTFTRIQLDVGIEDNIFTERFLRRPPAKYINN